VIMCWIGYCPPGKTPSRETLLSAIDQNPDGAGWSMRTPNGLEVVRALDDSYAVSSFLRARAIWPETHAVFHARYATHGEKDESNVHPFTVPGHAWSMAHNGMLPLSDGPFGSGRSDSRILAEDILSQMTWEDLKNERDTMEWWLQGDKVVILTGEKRPTGGPVIIYNENRGTWKSDGIWHSSALYTTRATIGSVTVADAVKPHVPIWINADDAPIADSEWWEDTLEQQALESALASEEAREYRELLDKYDRGTLSGAEWDALEAYEEKAYGVLTTPADRQTVDR
jgi:hypothetical protein